MKPVKAEEIKKAIGSEKSYGSLDVTITGVEMDSRIMDRGYCFFALPGERVDGNTFVRAAFEKGADCAVMTDEKLAAEIAAEFPGKSIIMTEDAEKALRDLAAWYITLFDIPKIAVTGSNGKTTTKDMTFEVVSAGFKAHKTPVNRNNLIGLPLTVLTMDEDVEAAVFEMGMDCRGEIHEMCRIVKPDVAIITNVGTAHVERLGSREEILNAKLEITDFLAEDGTLIIWNEGDYLKKEKAVGNYNLITSGYKEEDDYRIENLNATEDKVDFDLVHDGKTESYTIPVIGGYNSINASLAIAAGRVLGIPYEKAKEALLAYRPADKRMNITVKDGIKVIDDTYNASFPAMKVALDALETASGTRKVAILGDMFEQGDQSAYYHSEIGKYAAAKGAKLVIAIGDESYNTFLGAREALGEGGALHFSTKEELYPELAGLLKEGDTVLVKASRGMALDEVVKKILG